MRSAYSALVLCTLACASVPTTAKLASTGNQATEVALPASSTGSAAGRGHLLTGTFLTEYFTGETLYDVLRRRAPIYLRARPNPSAELGGRGADPIAVYIDGSFSGSIDVLSLIPASEVFSVQRISETDATVRFGPRHSSGALLVRMVRRD